MQRPCGGCPLGTFKEWSEPGKGERQGQRGGITGHLWATLRAGAFILRDERQGYWEVWAEGRTRWRVQRGGKCTSPGETRRWAGPEGETGGKEWSDPEFILKAKPG